MFYFNSASDKQKFPSVSPKKWEETSCTLEFSELAVIGTESKYRLYMVLSKDVKAMERGADEKWKDASTSGIPLFIDVKRTASTYKGKTTEPSRLEKFVAKQIDSTDTAKVYKGSIALQDSPMLQMVVDGVTATGQPVDEATKTMLLGTMWNLAETEPTKLVLSELEAPMTSKGGWSGGGSQNEIDKLNDRMNFIKAQLAITVTGYEPKSILDLTEPGLAANKCEKPVNAMMTIDACLKLMGCESWFRDSI